jgi:hypothetical protein
MSFFSSLRNRTSTRSPRSQAQRRPAASRFRPQLEALENREVPSTLTVSSADVEAPTGLRTEIAAAANGDTIVFAPSLNGQTIHVLYQLTINKTLTIQGPGAGLLALSGADVGAIVNPRILQVAAGVNVTLSGLTLEDGGGTADGYFNNSANDPQPWDQYGGAILNFGTLWLSGCTFSSNSAGSLAFATAHGFYGGAIYNAGTLTVINSTLFGNVAGSSPQLPAGFGSFGGGIYNAGTTTLSSSTVTNNAAQYGGGIYNVGTLAIDYSTVTNNFATIEGADLFNLGTFNKVHSTIGHIAK